MERYGSPSIETLDEKALHQIQAFSDEIATDMSQIASTVVTLGMFSVNAPERPTSTWDWASTDFEQSTVTATPELLGGFALYVDANELTTVTDARSAIEAAYNQELQPVAA